MFYGANTDEASVGRGMGHVVKGLISLSTTLVRDGLERTWLPPLFAETSSTTRTTDMIIRTSHFLGNMYTHDLLPLP